MLARLPSLIVVRFWALLLLSAIGLQATNSTEYSARASTGSAFSAATSEVALYVQRGERVQKQAIAPQPLIPVLAEALRPLPVPALDLAPAQTAWEDSTGPPTRRILSWKPAPRAPPRA
jgi:hypothetical protein